MPAGYGCADDQCTSPVTWLLTHMQPPGTVSVCDDHAPVFMIGMLAGVLGVDTPRLYDVIKRHVDKEARRLAAEAEAEAQALEAAEAAEAAEVNHTTPPPPMSRQAAEATESGGLVIDRGAEA